MKFNRTLVLAAIALALTACNKGPNSTGPASTSPPVATVNGQPISREIYEFYVKNVAGRPSSELSAEQRDQALDNLVRALAIAQEAEKNGTAKENDTAVRLELTRYQVLQGAVSEKYLKDKQPTEQEMRAEYETQVAAMPHLEYHARQIVVATQQFAEKLVKDIEKGAKFEDVAKRESMEAKGTDGDIGWFTPDRMPKPFADAVTSLKPGDFTHNPVQTQAGWHIVKLEETRDLQPPAYDGVKQRLAQVVLAKRFKSYVDDLLKTAKVEKKLEPAAAATPEKK